MMILLAVAIESASAEPANFHQTYSVHPLIAVVGQYEVSGEWRTADKVGVMASPMFVQQRLKIDDVTYDVVGGIVSAQGRYYALGTFSSGLFLGGMGAGGFVSVARKGDDAANATSAVAEVGPVLGGKLGFSFGLTLDADFALLLGQTISSATVGSVSATSTSTFEADPILEVRAGWSFCFLRGP